MNFPFAHKQKDKEKRTAAVMSHFLVPGRKENRNDSDIFIILISLLSKLEFFLKPLRGDSSTRQESASLPPAGGGLEIFFLFL